LEGFAEPGDPAPPFQGPLGAPISGQIDALLSLAVTAPLTHPASSSNAIAPASDSDDANNFVDNPDYRAYQGLVASLAEGEGDVFVEALQGSVGAWLSVVSRTKPAMAAYLSDREQEEVLGALPFVVDFLNPRAKAAKRKHEEPTTTVTTVNASTTKDQRSPPAATHADAAPASTLAPTPAPTPAPMPAPTPAFTPAPVPAPAAPLEPPLTPKEVEWKAIHDRVRPVYKRQAQPSKPAYSYKQFKQFVANKSRVFFALQKMGLLANSHCCGWCGGDCNIHHRRADDRWVWQCTCRTGGYYQ
jgi:hypothetical protein